MFEVLSNKMCATQHYFTENILRVCNFVDLNKAEVIIVIVE